MACMGNKQRARQGGHQCCLQLQIEQQSGLENLPLAGINGQANHLHRVIRRCICFHNGDGVILQCESQLMWPAS